MPSTSNLTLEEEIILAFDESKINRVPKGGQGGGRFANKSGGKSGGKSGDSNNKSSGKSTKKLHKEVKKLHGEVKKATSPEAIAKHAAAGIAIEATYHKFKPKAKKAAIAAAQFMKEKFGQTSSTSKSPLAKKEFVKEPFSKAAKAVSSGAKKAITKRPGWKVIATQSKKLMKHPAVKKAAELLVKTGKFAAHVAIGSAPFLGKALAVIGTTIATATLPQIALAGTIAAATAYGVYKLHKYYKQKREEHKIEQIIERLHQQYGTQRNVQRNVQRRARFA